MDDPFAHLRHPWKLTPQEEEKRKEKAKEKEKEKAKQQEEKERWRKVVELARFAGVEMDEESAEAEHESGPRRSGQSPVSAVPLRLRPGKPRVGSEALWAAATPPDAKDDQEPATKVTAAASSSASHSLTAAASSSATLTPDWRSAKDDQEPATKKAKRRATSEVDE